MELAFWGGFVKTWSMRETRSGKSWGAAGILFVLAAPVLYLMSVPPLAFLWERWHPSSPPLPPPEPLASYYQPWNWAMGYGPERLKRAMDDYTMWCRYVMQ